MNLQTMTIIFVIIFMPILLITTYYIQSDVDTISLQMAYDTKLIDATTDAVSAFEINTSNEDLSAISDSLRSIIEASNNVFTTTLATNLGMSNATKSRILPYIPAVVYVLYDGFYIYTPTQQPKVVTNEKGVYVSVSDYGVTHNSGDNYEFDSTAVEPEGWTKTTTNVDLNTGKILYYKSDVTTGTNVECTINPDEAYYTTSYILKSFIPYSMRYNNNYSDDVIINYTLDNFISLYGTIKGVYYSKSGYLVDYDKITLKIDSNEYKWEDMNKTYDLSEINDLVNDENKTITITIDGVSFSSNDNNSAISKNSKGESVSDVKSAIEYYIKSAMFSKWVDDNFSDRFEDSFNPSFVKTDYLNADGAMNYEISQNYYDVAANQSLFWNYNNDRGIFRTNGDWMVENDEILNSTSNFIEHKNKVIKNSIQYNLNLAMAAYNAGYESTENYRMPVLQEEEWDKLLSNISMLTFMQGLPCGNKTYNNYAIVTSTNNEFMTNMDSIYYVPVKTESKVNSKFGGNMGVLTSEDLELTDDEKKMDNKEDILNAKRSLASGAHLPIAHRLNCSHIDSSISYYESFPSKEVKYDKIWNVEKNAYTYDHVCNLCYYCIINNNTEKITSIDSTRQIAEKIAIGKIKNNMYKSSEVASTQGLFVDNPVAANINFYALDTVNTRNSYEIHITLKDAKMALKDNFNDSIYKLKLGNEEISLNCTTNEPQTLIFKKSSDWNGWTSPKLTCTTAGAIDSNKLKVLSVTYKLR